MDFLRECEIVRIFRLAARAHRTGHFFRMADVEDDAEIGAIAGRDGGFFGYGFC